MPTDLLTKVNDLKSHTHPFSLWRRMWDEYSDLVQFQWETRPLVVAERENIPEVAGIYSLIIQPGIANHPGCSYLIYVGQTNSLNRRFGEYLNEAKREKGRPKIYHMLNMYPDHICFCYSPVAEDQLDTAENALIGAYIPPSNTQYPATIRRVVGAFR